VGARRRHAAPAVAAAPGRPCLPCPRGRCYLTPAVAASTPLPRCWHYRAPAAAKSAVTAASHPRLPPPPFVFVVVCVFPVCAPPSYWGWSCSGRACACEMDTTDVATTPPPDLLRELLKVLLGVASLPADVDEHVSTLFKAMYALEERCPALGCHFHVSGVSQSTGKSFFVVLYDAALSASAGARRVIQTVYTSLHAELAMTTTAALWRRSLGPRLGAELDSLSLPAAAPGANVGVPPVLAAADPSAGADNGAGTAAARAPAAASDGVDAAAAPLRTPGGVAAAAPALDPDGGAGALTNVADGALPPTAGPQPSEPGPTSAYFSKPAIFYPSAAAIWCMEALFTVKGQHKGWVGVVRGTLTLVRVALLHQYGAACRSFVQGKLPWWPVDKASRRKVADEKGSVSDQCAHFPYPVAVQRRHLPHGERTRDEDDVEERMVTLTEIYTAKAPNFHLIVALLLLLFDKEPCMKTAIVDRLQNLGVTVDADLEYASDEALPGLTIDDPRLKESFLLSTETPRGTPRAPRTPTPPSTPPSDPSPDGSNDGADAVEAPTARARIEARRRAAAGSQKAAALQRMQKAKVAAERASRKRGGAERRAPSAKKARGQSRRDAVDLDLPDLDPGEDIVCLPVHAEAALLAAHTYESLATNWSPPVALLVDKELEVERVAVADWPAVKQAEKNVEIILDENTARSARKLVMQEAEAMRASGVVDPNSECPIVVKAKITSTGEMPRLSMASLLAMGDLHVAAERLQLFRGALAWVKSVATKLNTRVPTFYCDGDSTLGELGTEVMQVVIRSNPSATVWRSDAQPGDDESEDVQLSASAVVGNMGAAWMTDQFLGANQTILRRWVRQNKPQSYALPVSFFVPLLAPKRGPAYAAEVHAAVAAAAAKAFQLAGAVSLLAGVCNIDNQHWVAFSINMTDKVVALCDSGQIFESLKEDVAEAVVRVKAFGRRLRAIIDEAAAAKVVEQSSSDPPGGGAGEGGGVDAVVGGASGGETVTKKSWSQRKVRGLSQTDTFSCGAFAFSSVWHTLREEKSKVLAVDADAVRLEMIATVVRDGVIQEEARAVRAPPVAAGGTDVVMEG